jgi:transketolase
MRHPDVDKLKSIAREIRIDILTMLASAKSGHPGGSLSIVEILVALYFYKLKHRPKNPSWEDRDRFLLSKGHACPALYAVLSAAGYFPKKELTTLRKLGSCLQGHPKKGSPVGVEIASGSLGQGLSIANGIAFAMKLDKKEYRVYCLMGDGETHEGQIWEAAMSSSHYKLDNLCAIIDYNNFCIDGRIEEVMSLEPYLDKWRSFGFNAIDVKDGHDLNQLMDAYDNAEKCKTRPTVIICHTIKGKGVSFMENVCEWHGVAPNKEQLDKALEELGGL